MENQDQRQLSHYEMKMLEAFLNTPEKLQWYHKVFARCASASEETTRTRWNWSWWAFFGGVFFLLYRKAYLPALGLLIASLISVLIPFGGLAVWIMAGGFSADMIYLTYQKKKERIEAEIDDEHERIARMREVGGYHTWAFWVGCLAMGTWAISALLVATTVLDVFAE